ncbi:MAG: outer membrane protein assembly factor BamC [Psychromonas sp.]
MKKIFNKTHLSIATISLSLTACAAFENRMQPIDNYDYLDAEIVEKYQTGSFSHDEQRNNYDLPVLTSPQDEHGYEAPNIDIRPPEQLISVIDGVFLDSSENKKTKILVNALDVSDNTADKVWELLGDYLETNNVEFVSKNNPSKTLETKTFTQTTSHGASFSENVVVKESSYRLNVEEIGGRYGASFTVDALSYSEVNDGNKLPFTLSDKTKRNVELRFVNEFLVYVYQYNASLDQIDNDSQPLSIRLGFDDNNQTAWIADEKFLDTWARLPRLLTLLNFEQVEVDRNLGYMLLEYSEPSDSYWEENNLNKFDLDNGEYFIQLGELSDGTTSIVWLDENKKPLENSKVSEIYLSITEQVREALLLNNQQSQSL